MPAVTFQLAFTGAASTDAAAESGKALTFTPKARQSVIKLCEFHLNFALAASGALRENIQNQRGAVHNTHAGFLFQIALLRGTQFPVGNQQINFVLLTKVFDFAKSTAADISCGVRVFELLRQHARHLGAGGGRQFFEFRKRRFTVIFPGIHAHKQRAFRLLPVFVKFHGFFLFGSLGFFISLPQIKRISNKNRAEVFCTVFVLCKVF